MTNRLVKARREAPKALGAKVQAGQLFTMAQGLRDEPTLAVAQ
jgi:hypothetical protein